MKFDTYDTGDFFDEMFAADGQPRPGYLALKNRLESLPDGEINARQAAAEQLFYDLGITFTVYGHSEGTEKIFPFDIVPRIIERTEWESLERGLKQRIYALNLFINDIYHDQKIVKDGVVPEALIKSADGYFPECAGIDPPLGVWCHITGTDLVRDEKGDVYVLEDNLRSPSGVSYVLANRRILKRTLPLVFQESNIRPVDNYPAMLLDMLQEIAPVPGCPSC